MEIKRDNLENEKVVALLHEHLSDMRATSPPESVHALDVNALTLPNITFFSAWEGDALAGCIAIKKLNGTDAEIKSMRTSHAYRRQGVGNKLLVFLLDYAKEQGYLRISLETGTQDYFLPARKLYKKFGFVDCGPFSNYKLDPNSHFMSRDI
ncbi:GNAT family N-acetyltransferase [Alteromonas sp. V450]|uniref:GNAT family N-acetyltransferase n=1 Tax=Alteromonas sp. V450 TaxID=1912139 RepID=UPI0008FF2116|nr:GNAT family N-acetyltransferase [Alteromonas sp. V450]OJF68056.1 GNAT family N-acetyltransferase [Alteromonas sp. V450]|tara:strand:+ start:1126 stop:1581 length:456 start_codon:yes stop_codon:yes gene_type:complete